MRIIFSFFFLMVSLSIIAQSYDTVDSVNKKAKKCYKEGILLSQRAEFDKALEHFNKTIKKYPKFIDAILQRASIYYEQEKYAEAIEGFNEVLEIDPNYNDKIFYTLGVSYYKYGDYSNAEKALSTYLSKSPKNKNLVKKATDYLLDARTANKLSADAHDISLDPLPEAINTVDSEYLPCFTLDGNTLVFTRRINGDEDFYFSEKNNGSWAEAKPMTRINTGNNEGAQTLSADGRLLIFTGCSRRDGLGSCDLYYSFKNKGIWSTPKNMGEEINTPGWESQPSLSADGRTLYFASNRSGGQGGNDIWMSKRSDEGYFDTPINLGDVINTRNNEFAPFIHADDRTLYFTSDGHPGFGDTDIFKSSKEIDGQWKIPVNLGAPVNTNKAEGALVISTYGDTAYFARTQEHVRSTEMDIYSFVLPESLRPMPVTYLRTVVRDKVNGKLISSATLILSDNNTGETLLKQKSKSDGTYIVALPIGKDYNIRIEKEDYIFYSERIELDGIHNKNEPYNYEILLQPITEIDIMPEVENSDPIILNNVFFESNKSDLLDKSIPELISLYDHMIKYPQLKIQINGHTDNVGEESDNQTLSENRARSVYRFLIEKGISANRLSYKGYGEVHPISDNDTEAGRSRNRRTEFIILK